MKPLSLYWRRRRDMALRIIDRTRTSQVFTTSVVHLVTRVVRHEHWHPRESVRELRVVEASTRSAAQGPSGGGERLVGRAGGAGDALPLGRVAPWRQRIASSPTLRAVVTDSAGPVPVSASRTMSPAAGLPRGQRPAVVQPGRSAFRSGRRRTADAAAPPQLRRAAAEWPAARVEPRVSVSPLRPSSAGVARPGGGGASPPPAAPKSSGTQSPSDARLVWRAPRTDSDTTREQALPPATRSAAGREPAPAMANAVVSSGSAAVSPVTQRSDAPRAIALDGAAIDRLAEDVMNRIDRRIRIERERRGL